MLGRDKNLHQIGVTNDLSSTVNTDLDLEMTIIILRRHCLYSSQLQCCIACPWTGKRSRYVTSQVDSAFYPLWDGKMSISFRAE